MTANPPLAVARLAAWAPEAAPCAVALAALAVAWPVAVAARPAAWAASEARSFVTAVFLRASRLMTLVSSLLVVFISATVAVKISAPLDPLDGRCRRHRPRVRVSISAITGTPQARKRAAGPILVYCAPEPLRWFAWSMLSR